MVDGSNGGTLTQLPTPPTPSPDTVTRRIHHLVDRTVRQSIIERYGLTRLPGSVYVDENGEVA